MGNPTDELRAKLDELGIKYTTDDSNDYEIVEWQGPYNLWWQFVYDPYEEEPYGELRLRQTGGATHLTPEQAIAATVGAGTCKGEIDSDYFTCKLTTFKCHSCGWSGIVDNGYAGYSFDGTDMPRHCPNCGRRTKED